MCSTPSVYDLSCLECCLRLIRSMKDPKVAAEAIRRRMGEEHLQRVREAWRESNGAKPESVTG
jgi:hypothetical protein